MNEGTPEAAPGIAGSDNAGYPVHSGDHVKPMPLDTFYVTQEHRQLIFNVLEAAATALKNHGHRWTSREAEEFNRAWKLVE